MSARSHVYMDMSKATKEKKYRKISLKIWKCDWVENCCSLANIIIFKWFVGTTAVLIKNCGEIYFKWKTQTKAFLAN